MRKLTSQTFRYPSGRVVAEQPIGVVFRGSNTLAPLYGSLQGLDALPNPMTTDVLGNIDFYTETGSYDFLVNGHRQPFDILQEGGGSGGSDTFVEWVQASPAADWNVPNAIGRTPQVGVIIGGELVLADVEYGEGFVTITHAYPTTGKVILT